MKGQQLSTTETTQHKGKTMTDKWNSDVRGVLLADGWATADWCNSNSLDEMRNKLISSIDARTDIRKLHGMPDSDLIAYASSIIILLGSNMLTEEEMSTLNATAIQGEIIKFVTYKDDDETLSPLLSFQSIVKQAIGSYTVQNDIEGFINIEWHMDDQKISTGKPKALTTKIVENSSSSGAIKSTEVLTDTITTTSKVTTDSKFGMSSGVTVGGSSGIPRVSSVNLEAKLGLSYDHSWTKGEDNTIQKQISETMEVTVPPGKKIMLTLLVTEVTANVSYSATVRMTDGGERRIKGSWEGVAVTNSAIKVTDV